MQKIKNPLKSEKPFGSPYNYAVIKGGGYHTHMFKFYRSSCHKVSYNMTLDTKHTGPRIILRCKK